MSRQARDRSIIEADRLIQAKAAVLRKLVKRNLRRQSDRRAAIARAAVLPLTDKQRTIQLMRELWR